MKNTKIIIIEDELIIAKDLENTLITLGYEVLDIFISGEKFLLEYEKYNPDLILMDICLAGDLDGIETANLLNTKKNIPIIFLTANSETEKIERAKEVSPFGFLLKPYNKQELKATIEITLYKHKLFIELENNEKRFQIIVENSHDGIIITKTTGKIIFCNSKAKNEISKLQNKLDEKQIIQSILTEEQWDFFYDELIVQEREKVGQIIDVKTDDDKVLKIEITCDKITLQNQQNLVFHLLDITDKYKSYHNLRMLATAIQSIDECLYITDGQNNVIYVNETFCKKFEYDFFEILNKNIFDTIFRYFNKEKLIHLQNTIKHSNWSREIELVSRTNKKIPVSATISVINDKHKYLVGVLRDISNELFLKKQINQVQRLESIGKLAGGIAHDFNNLLSIISGYTELMLTKTDKTDPNWEFLDEIYNAGERAINLTRQLLLFSKTTVGEITTVNLNEIINNLYKMLNRLIGENIKLNINLTKDLKNISADKGQIEQVLMNLTINARDAIHDNINGQKQINIKTENVYLDEEFVKENIGLDIGNFIKLSIKDTGKGISKENIEKIFDPFFTTKSMEEGTGLGLSTVYGIVKKYNGAIFVNSKIDEGTLFDIYIPITQHKNKKNNHNDKTFQKCSGTILIVEDTPSLLKLSEKMLKSLGFKTLSADTGEKAIAIAQEFKEEIDLVFTDLIMPNNNGVEIFHKIQNIHPNMKVLFTSGYDDKFLKTNHVEVNEKNFIRKPFERQNVYKMISSILNIN